MICDANVKQVMNVDSLLLWLPIGIATKGFAEVSAHDSP